ncbi:U11/U12 small nuclear ribonucleoprotein 35 kDa protein [Zootermopsis nevadensis]|uniref:U11/U12 small nuclear ribonucleoprotein 35 kDa protein n=1 Tax=Zootermopsis nevadensis TaxID=136037 RepID=A0A067R061_ZOONE|nr:U11/U12 small nuclear ribonucleoprotein 35 kDa protein [Zootermopsis nevadensis]
MNWMPYAQVYDPLKVGSIDGTDPDPHDRAIIRALDSEYEPDKNVKGKSDRTIFVARLYRQTKEDSVVEEFSKYGPIRRFRLIRDIVTGSSKGYAFIEYEKKEAANQAYHYANNLIIDGRRIFVDFECGRKLPGWKPRRLGGGFGGKKESGQLRFGGRDRPFRKPLPVPVKKK